MTERFNVIGREKLMAARKKSLENGYVFPLETTSIEAGETIEANVRRISMVDKAILDILPVDVQQVVWQGLQEYQREAKKAQAAGDPQSLAEAVRNNVQVLKAADAWCLASFINPRLVRTQDELSLYPDAWLVDDVAAEDRIALMQACTDSSTDAAKMLKTFRPQSKADAGDDGAVPTSAHAAESVLED